MNKLANVVFAYSPKNDDELELKVGDKIEVIGVEEEGWWKGQLRGRIGVFPSNFVQVIDTPNIQSNTSSQAAANANKLNSIFGAKAASTKTPTSLSSTSLSSNNSTSCGAINNISNNLPGGSSNNLTMSNNNNTPQSQPGLMSSSANTSSEDPHFGERRPKPIKGIGYGDIFASGGAKLKPLPVDATKPPLGSNGRPNERMGSGLSGSSPNQKQIPKKPPPPTPTNDNLNGSSSSASSEQAPALPPKPTNQFSPHMHQTRPLLPPVQPIPSHQPHMNSLAHQPPISRERARVVYAYEPLNDDELAMKVGDIIEIIDKDIEDAGWWKGELRGKVGVFPDNFVELIEPLNQPSAGNRSEWQHQSVGGTPNPNIVPQTTPTGPGYFNSNIENNNKIKSVFAATPKGFSKELESNLEKHGSTPASFLSLKRNKIHQQQAEDLDHTTEMGKDVASVNDEVGSLGSNTTKLNHITANRAKGPNRRPPSNILNKRNQFDSLKRELTNGGELNRIEKSSQNNPNLNAVPQQQQPNHESSSSLSSSQHHQSHAAPSILLNRLHDKGAPTELDDGVDNEASIGVNATNQAITGLPASSLGAAPSTPKTSQRFSQQQQQPQQDKTTASTTTPPWMVEWKKTHAEKKRDTPIVGGETPTAEAEESLNNNNITNKTDMQTNSSGGNPPQQTVPTPPNLAPVDLASNNNERKTSVHSLRENYNPTVKSMTSRYSADPSTPVSGNTPNESANNRFTTHNAAMQESSNTLEQASMNRPNSSLNKTVINKSSLQNSPPKDSDTNGVLPATANSNNNNNKFLNSRSRFESGSDGSNNQANTQHVSLNTPTTNQRPNNGVKSASIGDNSIDATLALKDELASTIKLQYEKLFQQISDKVENEVTGLRSEIVTLRKELDGMDELKRVVEVMKLELKACQSATDNQRKYIKELVGNLADERKKIAAMQVELDRNLK